MLVQEHEPPHLSTGHLPLHRSSLQTSIYEFLNEERDDPWSHIPRIAVPSQQGHWRGPCWKQRVTFESLGPVVLALSSRWRCEYTLIFVIKSGKGKWDSWDLPRVCSKWRQIPACWRPTDKSICSQLLNRIGCRFGKGSFSPLCVVYQGGKLTARVCYLRPLWAWGSHFFTFQGMLETQRT